MQPEEDVQSLDTPLSEERTEAVSEISSRPPPVGTRPNEDSDWLHSWQRARGAVTAYARAEGRRQLGRNPFVHLLICRQGDTTSAGVDCPDWILDTDRPVHLFSNWCQQFAFPFDVRYIIPSIVLVDYVPTGHCPLIIQVAQARSAFCVYDVIQIERVAGIIHWVTRRLMLPDHCSITFNDRRVEGGDDIRIQPGDVLSIRSLTGIAVINPADSTAEPTTSLGQFSHTTWSSLSDLRPDSMSSQDMTHRHRPEHIVIRPLQEVAASGQISAPAHMSEGYPGNARHDDSCHEEVEDGSFLTILTRVSLPVFATARISRDHVSYSEAAYRIDELTWQPMHNDNWIDMVARRELAVHSWDDGHIAHLLRPEEPLLPVRLDFRAIWFPPAHFDLPGILWTAWPDLNYVRFRIYEVRSHYRVDQHPGLITLVVRPHRWGLSPEVKVAVLEVVRLQWDSIISRMTALLIRRPVTHCALVQDARVRDCAVFYCEARYEGRPLMPDTEVEFLNGDLLTIVVRSDHSAQRVFKMSQIPFTAGWDSRRWRSQEQSFHRNGRILIFRITERHHVADSRVRIPVEDWYAWNIVYGDSHMFIRRVLINRHWEQCPEFRGNMEAIILDDHDSLAITRTVLVLEYRKTAQCGLTE